MNICGFDGVRWNKYFENKEGIRNGEAIIRERKLTHNKSAEKDAINDEMIKNGGESMADRQDLKVV